MRHILGFVLIVTIACGTSTPRQAPDLVIVNGRVFTGIDSRPWAEALAIVGDRITLVGTSAEVREAGASAARVIDAGGRLIIPGINDAHVHVGAMPPSVRLDGPPAMEHDPPMGEVLERVKAAVARAPDEVWIFGEIGAAVLDDPKATRLALDTVAADHPVALRSWTGHGTLYNTVALRRLGVRDDEPDPPGGYFVRLPGTRTVSGIAHEYADFTLRTRIGAEAGEEAHVTAIREFGREAAALGITSVQVMGTAGPVPEIVRRVEAAGIPQRVRVIDFPMTGMAAWTAPASRDVDGTAAVTVSGTKWVMDGTPIERLMFLREPYADRPDTRGRLNFSQAELVTFLRRAREAHEQPMLHIVGDAGIDAMLAALEEAGGSAWQALRPRLEHGDMLEPSHIERASRAGVILVQNPSHFMIPQVVRPRLGDRVDRAWMLKSTVAAGIPVALGSDGPLNPFLNVMFATISANNPAEAMTREQAIAAYTRGSAFAEFKEGEKGTLAPGMLADLAILSRDIFTVPPDALPATTSVLTVVGGKVAHERK